MGAAVGLALVASPSATAHRDAQVSLCIPFYKGGPCPKKNDPAPSYYYGKRIPVKGRVKPRHDGTVRIQRRKGEQPWRTVAKRAVDEDGRYRYEWQTRRRHADQGRPYKFRAVFPGHDKSRVKKVFVLLFE
ncbi:MAG: hypothetical protein M3134_00675 [Actinomycetota bacterium]|nr:hypothetical protein [Actinomycetota bacterium]